MPRKPVKRTEEWWRKKCATDAKTLARIRDKYTCQYCGKKKPEVAIHGSHIYAEGIHKSMSADVDNILSLCFTHHTGGYHPHEPSWHQDPVAMVEWFNAKYPELSKKLRIRSQKCRRINWEKKRGELRELIKEIDV